MVAYEFYRPDPLKGDEFLGILPERRKNPERITQKSIMGWAEKLFGNDLNTRGIYFISVTMNEETVNIFRPAPIFTTQQKTK